MPATVTLERYGGVAIALHWSIALLIIANWPLGYFSEGLEKLTGQSPVALHKSVGLTVLALSLLRLLWRLGHPPPAYPAPMAPWRAAVARFTHISFYVLIIALPLSGWLRTSAGKYPLTWFGLVDIPKFAVAPGSSEAKLAAQSHELLGWAMLLLVALHVAAALHHHFRLRDAMLLRMAPSSIRRS
jgi:cytochrome b561